MSGQIDDILWRMKPPDRQADAAAHQCAHDQQERPMWNPVAGMA
jgi:hypothetical protein